ncbi:hypothetical protein NC652_039276 [Populus alba x Populus x berolinensis]|nr:hypothetical protein NC652_039276 [Populus alba x Populus x berolinensis]
MADHQNGEKPQRSPQTRRRRRRRRRENDILVPRNKSRTHAIDASQLLRVRHPKNISFSGTISNASLSFATLNITLTTQNRDKANASAEEAFEDCCDD